MNKPEQLTTQPYKFSAFFRFVQTKILETLVELDDGHELPLGLRVQACVLAR